MIVMQYSSDHDLLLTSTPDWSAEEVADTDDADLAALDLGERLRAWRAAVDARDAEQAEVAARELADLMRADGLECLIDFGGTVIVLGPDGLLRAYTPFEVC
jgi:hypothetical protein